jgi:hypothetical protein
VFVPLVPRETLQSATGGVVTVALVVAALGIEPPRAPPEYAPGA